MDCKRIKGRKSDLTFAQKQPISKKLKIYKLKTSKQKTYKMSLEATFFNSLNKHSYIRVHFATDYPLPIKQLNDNSRNA